LFYLLVVLSATLVGCSDDPAPIPTFPPNNTEGGEQDGLDGTDTVTEDDDTYTNTDVESPADTVTTDSVTPPSDTITDGGVADTEEPTDTQGATDAASDAGEEGGGDATLEDTGNQEGDGGTTAVPDTTEDVAEEDGGNVTDAESPPEDTGPPPECTSDNECVFLTALACCPDPPDPCIAAPETGLFEEELEVISWLAENCDPSLSCPDVVAPQCPQCHNVYSYEAVCDQELGECATALVLNCGALCEAAGQDANVDCPGISHPDALSPENLESCGCP